jgi:hypothetical protein
MVWSELGAVLILCPSKNKSADTLAVLSARSPVEGGCFESSKYYIALRYLFNNSLMHRARFTIFRAGTIFLYPVSIS